MADIKDALQYAVLLAAPNIYQDDDGHEWSDKELHEVLVDLPAAVNVSTLSGLRDLLSAKIEALVPTEVFVHVVSHDEVSVLARSSDKWGRRQQYVIAKLANTDGFKYGQFLDHETFLIGVMAHFTPSGDRDYLVKIASFLSTERVRTSVDDGISQEITLKQSSGLKTAETIRNRVTLAPFRTFREVDQPASEFLFRLRGGSETAPPTMALIEADGGKWKIDAMETIGRYLRTTLDQAGDVTVVI